MRAIILTLPIQVSNGNQLTLSRTCTPGIPWPQAERRRARHNPDSGDRRLSTGPAKRPIGFHPRSRAIPDRLTHRNLPEHLPSPKRPVARPHPIRILAHSIPEPRPGLGKAFASSEHRGLRHPPIRHQPDAATKIIFSLHRCRLQRQLPPD